VRPQRAPLLLFCSTLAFALAACPAEKPRPVPAPRPLAKTPAGELFELRTDPVAVDKVMLEGQLPGAPLTMRRVAPGHFRLRVEAKPQTMVRYRFRVHRADLDRWIRVADPLAWQLDASRARWSMRLIGRKSRKKAKSLARPPAFDQLVIYELCPREVVRRGTPYADLRTAPTGDHPPFGAVFRAITKRIRSGYYDQLGVTALELMPVLAQGWRSAKRRSAKGPGAPSLRPPWGYQALSWYAVNGDYGTADELIELIDAAHARGLAVLADVSLEHGYGGKENGLITDLWPRWRVAKPKNPWGLLELDLAAPGALPFTIGGLRRLLVDFGFDGLRLDWTEKVPPKTWKRVVAQVRRFAPKAILISENPTLPLVTEAGMDGTWDFFFHWEAPLLLRRVYRNWDGFGKRMVDTQRKLVENLRGRAYPPHGAKQVAGIDASKAPPVVRYLESHDLPRIARPRVRWQHGGGHLMDANGDGKTPDWLDHGSQAVSRLGATLLTTLPGAILLFQGQEHGASDDLIWAYDPLATRGDAETLAHYRKLLRLRAKLPALRRNDLRILLSDEKRHVLAYSRGNDPARGDDDKLVVVLNFAPRALSRVQLPMPSAGRWRDVMTGKTYRAAKKTLTVSLPLSGSMLLQRL
jgi:1,4-alpha-glucan branching enzyme